MNPQFSQAGGSVSKDVNKQSIARVLGVKMSEVAYLKSGLVVDSYKVLYDKTTQTCWYRGNATGTVVSWITHEMTLDLLSSAGQFTVPIADIIKNLNSTDSNMGGSLVKLPQKISVTDALKGIVVVAGADNTNTIDSTGIIQSYIDYARDNGINKVRLPAGIYKVQSYTNRVELPHDDGTVYPSWVTSGSDVNITPEPTRYMYSALKLYPGIQLIGDGMGTTIIDGGWDIATSPLTNSSGIGIWYYTNNFQSDHDGGGIKDITLQRYFVARYGTGCTVDTEEDGVKLKRVGVAGIFQAKERCKQGFIYVDQAFAGEVIGGQWWYRSNSTSAAYMPPYPAPQIYLTGWMDACITEQYWYIQYLSPWGTRHEQLDTFFDTYFFQISQ